jgi:AcrR family transcriptional regulator
VSSTQSIAAPTSRTAEFDDWRARLRTTLYELYRKMGAGEGASLPVGAEVEALFALIDEGRAEPTAPLTLTRVTAESLAGSIFWQLSLAAGREGPLPSEAELVPALMFPAVLPYVGPVAAAEELRIPPPPR